jgi:Zn-dependent metalloprotease
MLKTTTTTALLHLTVALVASALLASGFIAGSAFASVPPPEFTKNRAAAETHVTQLKQRYPATDALFTPGQPGVHVVTGLALKPHGASHEEMAANFLADHFALTGVRGQDFEYLETSTSKHRMVVRFQQVFAKREVVDRLVAVRMELDGTILGLVSDAMPVGRVPKANVTANSARQIAVTWLGMRQVDTSKLHADAKILATPIGSRPVWVVHVVAVPMRDHLRVLIDAADGKVLAIRNIVQH